MTFYNHKKILLTGGAGFLGQHVYAKLIKKGVRKPNILVPRSKSEDLRKLNNVRRAVKGKDLVIHLAGFVGGIGLNKNNPGKMFYDNMLMGLHLFEQARLAKVKKLVALGTVCCYPKFCKVPFKEKDLWNGYPEETNAPYGLAKKMLLVMSQAYRKQYDFNSIFLLPANLYGPGDNFKPQSSHVIPSLIRKIALAKAQKSKFITVWGSGKATREFLYVEDAAKAIILAAEKYNNSVSINIGSGFEISIKKLVDLLVLLMDFKGKVLWDKDKPDGQPKRCLDTSKAFKEFGFKAKTDFKTGLKKTIKYYYDEFD